MVLCASLCEITHSCSTLPGDPLDFPLVLVEHRYMVHFLILVSFSIPPAQLIALYTLQSTQWQEINLSNLKNPTFLLSHYQTPQSSFYNPDPRICFFLRILFNQIKEQLIVQTFHHIYGFPFIIVSVLIFVHSWLHCTLQSTQWREIYLLNISSLFKSYFCPISPIGIYN